MANQRVDPSTHWLELPTHSFGAATQWVDCSNHSLGLPTRSLETATQWVDPSNRSLGLSRPGMKPVVERLQAFLVNVGVDLGGGDVGVAKHGLDRPQVGSVLQQMGGEAVAEHMGREAADAHLH